MNVVRDLRNTVTHLEAEVEKKNQLIKKQQTDYESIIASLQAENQKLKSLLQNESHREEEEIKYNPRYGAQTTSKKQQSNISCSQSLDLVNENNFLKSQIAQISATYQKQIDQIAFYFEKIKQESKRVVPSHLAGQLQILGSWMKAYIQDCEVEREKYERKLLQCASTLSLYQQTIRQQQRQIDRLRQEKKQIDLKYKLISKVLF